MTANESKTKVCFVAPHSYSLFHPENHFVFGGIEVQAYLTASELARRADYDVSFVVYDFGKPRSRVANVDVVPIQGKPSMIQRISKVFKSKSAPGGGDKKISDAAASLTVSGAGINELESASVVPVQRGSGKEGSGRVVRLKNNPITRPLYRFIMWSQKMVDFYKSLTWAWKIHVLSDAHNYFHYIQDTNRIDTYELIDADIYISFGANDLTAELTAFCRLNDKKVLLFSASDTDFHDSYFWGSNIRNYYGDVGDRCHFAIMRAHRLVTQNTRQHEVALASFQRESSVIANPIDLSVGGSLAKPFNERNFFLWIGKADQTKQPDVLVEVAKQLPDVDFLMILNPSYQAIEKKVRDTAPANLKIVSGVQRSKIPGLMEEAYALVNTSRFEGYPNTFLEAYRARSAVVSLNADPNDTISNEGTGIYANGDIGALVDGCRRLSSDAKVWETVSAAAHSYVGRVHDQVVVVDQVIDEIEETLKIDLEEEKMVDLSIGGYPMTSVLNAN